MVSINPLWSVMIDLVKENTDHLILKQNIFSVPIILVVGLKAYIVSATV